MSLCVAGYAVDRGAAFGASPEGARRARMEHSPQWKGGRFENPQPLHDDLWGALRDITFRGSAHRTPKGPVPVEALDPKRFLTAPHGGLRVTWLGHSTLLVELDGRRVLVDPVWGERASPVSWMGPRRFYAPLLPLDQVPAVDAVVISHDHYDHLDEPTIRAMRSWSTAFVVPLGVGAHLAAWGVPEARIVELDWWESARLGDLEIVATPARHASGRSLLSGRNATLWAGFALVGPRHRVYYSGDTGFFPGFADIGRRLGPFDLAMIEAGAYGRSWPDWHLGPEQAVRAAELVRAKVLLPVHWALFNLAYHGWTEPAERVLAAARGAELRVTLPRPGQSVEPDALPALARWWPEAPWKTAEEDPIVPTGLGGGGAVSLGPSSSAEPGARRGVGP
ncbi:MBL fold metallo-hydrolase [Anaeromyxobacter diazotrophicus]|uniref:Zn-dependent hydrolase n=1 Tax=Anaeromyxobacter diazotrophicus TaxID=2590199 RepID=A0A7I9VJK8_9BACT|nr:MBL fold metallo-hydrolase [Anaeromyxobacter diazotrophicus]GEJ56592.1 Zn-dependent hydrolase [Anaeromyxobacter diazotrophicus]